MGLIAETKFDQDREGVIELSYGNYLSVIHTLNRLPI